MPAKVDELFDDVKKKNPSYSDEQAWATAWSIYCKHVNPESDSCHQPTSEYLKGKSASGRTPRNLADMVSEEYEEAERARQQIESRYTEWSIWGTANDGTPFKGTLSVYPGGRHYELHIEGWGTTHGTNPHELTKLSWMKTLDWSINRQKFSYERVAPKKG